MLLPDSRVVRLPANLFLTGTLNLDEATHSLSRKVLDRANTLTFQGGMSARRDASGFRHDGNACDIGKKGGGKENGTDSG